MGAETSGVRLILFHSCSGTQASFQSLLGLGRTGAIHANHKKRRTGLTLLKRAGALRSLRVVEWLGFRPNFRNRNALLSGSDYRVINKEKLGTNFNNLFFLLKGFCTITHCQDCSKKDSSRRSSQKNACHSCTVPAVTYAALAPEVECVFPFSASLFATPTHLIGNITSAAVAYTASVTTVTTRAAGFDPDDDHISVLLFSSVAHDARR